MVVAATGGSPSTISTAPAFEKYFGIPFPGRRTTVSSIAISVGGLALFVIIGSWLLFISSPTVVQVYFKPSSILNSTTSTVSVTNSTADLLDSPGSDSAAPVSSSQLNNVTTYSDSDDHVSTAVTTQEGNQQPSTTLLPSEIPEIPPDTTELHSESDDHPGTGSHVSTAITTQEDHQQSSPTLLPSDQPEIPPNSTDLHSESDSDDHPGTGSHVSTAITTQEDHQQPSPTLLPSEQPEIPPNSTDLHSESGSCDLYHGSWFYDSSGPLYTNNTCPIITQMQNCQGNGRPDRDYENFRWKPSQCDLPRFDPKKFLELMRGKTLAFIGDSVARNQMESMLCILWQVEVPKNRGNKRMQRWTFKSTSVNIVRIWSSWLVHQSSEPLDFAPAGVVKLHLDSPDDGFMDLLPGFDVVVLSSGHWFAKQSVYVLNNEIVGGQLWWPDKNRPMKVNNVAAFEISVETILTAMGNHPNYTGLTIVRSYSPDHYEGGAWNTGGSCTGKSRPVFEGKLVENGFTNTMNEKQTTGFNKAVKKLQNQSKLRFMDITEAFSYRHDGHPGPYRNPDPKKITKRGPHGEPPPQDCLHWCMPGPVDTWNELVLEIIRREFEGSTTSPE